MWRLDTVVGGIKGRVVSGNGRGFAAETAVAATARGESFFGGMATAAFSSEEDSPGKKWE